MADLDLQMRDPNDINSHIQVSSHRTFLKRQNLTMCEISPLNEFHSNILQRWSWTKKCWSHVGIGRVRMKIRLVRISRNAGTKPVTFSSARISCNSAGGLSTSLYIVSKRLNVYGTWKKNSSLSTYWPVTYDKLQSEILTYFCFSYNARGPVHCSYFCIYTNT